MDRFLSSLFVTAGIIGAALLLFSVFERNEAVMNIGLILIMGSAMLLIAIVVLGRINCCQKKTRNHRNTLPN